MRHRGKCQYSDRAKAQHEKIPHKQQRRFARMKGARYCATSKGKRETLLRSTSREGTQELRRAELAILALNAAVRIKKTLAPQARYSLRGLSVCGYDDRIPANTVTQSKPEEMIFSLTSSRPVQFSLPYLTTNLQQVKYSRAIFRHILCSFASFGGNSVMW
jgi:hypothetical protein